MKIILASGSPRRKEMLERFNLEPIIIKSNIDEKIFKDQEPIQIAMSLAFEKAYEVSNSFMDDLVIGADTIVVNDGLILGKPKDEEDAFNMLRSLSSKTHEVITGISLIDKSRDLKFVDYECTQVKFKYLSDRLIKTYLNTGEYKDKAGSYGIQGKGAVLVEKINGCYSNVVGLPLSKLDYLLSRYFNLNILW